MLGERRLGEGVREMRASAVSGEKRCATGIVGSVGERTTKGGRVEPATDFSLTALSLSASNGFFSGSTACAGQSQRRVSAPPRVSTAAHIACHTSTITRTKSMRRGTLPGGCDVVFVRSDDRRVDGRRGAGFNDGTGGGDGGTATFFPRLAIRAGEDSERRGAGGATSDFSDQLGFRAWPPSPLLEFGNDGGNSDLGVLGADVEASTSSCRDR